MISDMNIKFSPCDILELRTLIKADLTNYIQSDLLIAHQIIVYARAEVFNQIISKIS